MDALFAIFHRYVKMNPRGAVKIMKKCYFDNKRLIHIFEQFDKINTVYLCGSYAQGSASENSDIDFAILPSTELSVYDEMRIQAALSEELSFENVDLINLSKAPVKLQFNLVSAGRIIYEKNAELTNQYIEDLLKQYHDRVYRYKRFQKDLEQGLREDYC